MCSIPYQVWHRWKSNLSFCCHLPQSKRIFSVSSWEAKKKTSPRLICTLSTWIQWSWRKKIMNMLMTKPSDKIPKILIKLAILRTPVFGKIKMELKKEKEKATSKSKYSSKNSKANSTGPNKKSSKWLKSLASPKVKSINGVGTKRRKTWRARIH